MNPLWHFVNGIPYMGPIAPQTVLASDGTASAPSYSFASAPTYGMYYNGAASIVWSAAGTNGLLFNSGGLTVYNNLSLGSSADVSLSRGAADRLDLASGDSMRVVLGTVDYANANGQLFSGIKQLTELTTIAAAATTDTTIQMPAGAVVLAVSTRVTVVIPTAATFTVGDSGSATRFNNAAAISTAANTTDAGTKAGAYYNASALSVRITPNATPAANTGRIRVTIYYYEVTPPSS